MAEPCRNWGGSNPLLATRIRPSRAQCWTIEAQDWPNGSEADPDLCPRYRLSPPTRLHVLLRRVAAKDGTKGNGDGGARLHRGGPTMNGKQARQTTKDGGGESGRGLTAGAGASGTKAPLCLSRCMSLCQGWCGRAKGRRFECDPALARSCRSPRGPACKRPDLAGEGGCEDPAKSFPRAC